MKDKTKPTPLTNAERQARRKRSGPRPVMWVTVSRWVQAAVDDEAEAAQVSGSEVAERALALYTGSCEVAGRPLSRSVTMALTERGAAILGSCTACKRELHAGDRVRRVGEFARHEGCQAPPK